MTQADFIATAHEIATHVPGINPEAAAAHAANESRYGDSRLAREGNNLFGVKAGASWSGACVEMPTWEVVNGQRVDIVAKFRAYDSWLASMEDYAAIIGRVYPWAARHSHDPVRFLVGIFSLTPKWATDPDALSKCVAILDKHGLLKTDQLRLGEHSEFVENSPTLASAWELLRAYLARRPALLGPRLVTRTQREDGSWKLDVRAP